MTRYVALLRAVNVGGTGKLPMAELKKMAEAAGFLRPRTYIASGNLVFESAAGEPRIVEVLEAALERYAGKPVGVLVRDAAALVRVRDANPFPDEPGNRVMAVFLGDPPPEDAIARATGRRGEDIRMGARELYVHYPDGMAETRLRIPAAAAGTARNMNTVAALIEMLAS